MEKANGKKNLIDGSPETCWTSQQGLPQFIQLSFEEKVIPKRVTITFQGGFVGTRCAISVPVEDANRKDWHIVTTIYPEDVNRQQTFDLASAEPEILQEGISSLRLVFQESSDFFGRITVYDLKLEGAKISSSSSTT